MGARNVRVIIVADDLAYLGVEAYSSSPHDCFVTKVDGRIHIDFDETDAGCGVNGGGKGINQGDAGESARTSRYAFHDILQITNKGTKRVFVWVNASTTSGSGSHVHAAQSLTTGQMTDDSYGPNAASPTTLTVGTSMYAGVRVKAGSLVAPSAVMGYLEITARAG